MKNKVHILGAGGIGVALAWSLVRAGWDVTVIDADARKVECGSKEGLTVVGFGTEHPAFTSFNEWTVPQNELILLCTKTYDNPAVLARLQNASRLIPVQNGFDPELDQRNHSGEGIASFVSECLRDRPVTRITRPGCLHLGPRRTVTTTELEDLRSLAASLSIGKLFPVQFVEDTHPFKAAKLMYNAAISPLAGAAGVDNGELLSDPLAKRLFFCVVARELFNLSARPRTARPHRAVPPGYRRADFAYSVAPLGDGHFLSSIAARHVLFNGARHGYRAHGNRGI